MGLGTRNAAPYKQVITHGFVVDSSGHKMSKSIGNTIEPQTIIEQSGAEILRLWVAMVDYQEEVKIGKQILARVIEAYRKIRNTLRILVANLYDFDPTIDALENDQLQEVDRYALARYGQVATRVLQAYDRYEFQSAVHALNHYLTVDLSAFYIDISKDRLYTLRPSSDARRSAQTTMHIIVNGLTRLLAPILPITADELWRNVPGTDSDSVHLADFPSRPESLVDTELLSRWTHLLSLRDAVNGELEKLRQDKVVGTSLEASVTLTADGELANLLDRYREELSTLFITSEVKVTRGATSDDNDTIFHDPLGNAGVAVRRIEADKCPRCWRWVCPVHENPNGETDVCDRCLDALSVASTPVSEESVNR